MSKITQNPSQRAALTRRAALGRIAKFSAILPSLLIPSVSKWNAPAPKFNFGDRVLYSFPGDDDEIVTYEGNVMGMVYCPKGLEMSCNTGSGWFYAVHWSVMPGCNLPHLFREIETTYLESESELRRA